MSLASLLSRRGARAATVPVMGLLLAALPGATLACACGCGVFDVGTGAMFPDGAGGLVYAELDYMNQNRNFSGTHSASADGNPDKEIRTDFYTVGMQYMFDRRFGVSIDVPYWQRSFTTTDDSGALATFDHGAIGDVRLRVNYTGFSHDMSSGVSFGVKLPTGDARYANFDADTEISSGSTDLLVGGWKLIKLTDDGRYNGYLRVLLQQPVAHRANYRPGSEALAVAGAYYHGWNLADGVRLTPLVQMTAAWRGHDGGPDGHPEDSGYTRLVASPGLELSTDRLRVYGEVGFNVVSNVSGQQLVADRLYKLSISYSF